MRKLADTNKKNFCAVKLCVMLCLKQAHEVPHNKWLQKGRQGGVVSEVSNFEFLHRDMRSRFWQAQRRDQEGAGGGRQLFQA